MQHIYGKGLNDLVEVRIPITEIKHSSFCRFIEIANVRQCRCLTLTTNVRQTLQRRQTLLRTYSLSVGFSLLTYIYTPGQN